ncbi:DUF115 domain-containing protein [Sulfurimonas sp. SWIR-19]|uniref:6-hydroxymethylpterin diphosphokinase MptE-like protein n=1 Tax=Sulfurimonas sp. SWIR-19 TaxID=2878390 RepID=UPI001CF2BC97|nr:6-hydroxymethylpterin diphosphokinase MptE-like protein [Sulfurimonas sp. SWIR-19]UCN00474.1 DUF115 domain-containing protein [Sulfurimonas sp. SWIR-19]
MHDVQRKAVFTYQENLFYFQEKHPDLYSKLIALDTLLNEGKYPQKYDLEYKNNYFDVVELHNNTYLYNTNSLQHAQQMSDNVTFTKQDHAIETFHNISFEVESLKADDLKSINPYLSNVSLAPIVHYYNANIPTPSTLTKIYKYIFFGTGLGLHLETITKKVNANIYWIIEDDLELFRLSLFTCNYKDIFQNTSAYFSIAQNDAEFSQIFSLFYTRLIIENHFLKFSIFSSKDEKNIKKVQTEITIRPEKVYTHNTLLLKCGRVLHRLKQGYKFISMEEKNLDFFQDKPILTLGAGPSLQKNEKWLQENHQKFIIIAPFMTLRFLYERKIIPDIIVHIDEQDHIVKQELQKLADYKENFKKSIVVFSASAPQILFDTFNKKNIYLMEDKTNYKEGQSLEGIASVGETIVAIALSFSSHDIYMLGLDLALSDDGASHISEHSTDHNVDTSHDKNIQEQNTLRESVLQVQGNCKNIVFTTPLFEMSIRAMNFQLQKSFTQQRRVFNLSQNGAYFQNTIPINITEVTLNQHIKNKNTYKELQNHLDLYSSDKLTQNEIILLQNRMATLKLYLKDLEEYYHAPTANSQNFIQNFALLITKYLQRPNDELYQITFGYILETTTYIADFFSTKELKNEKKHVKKLKKMFYILVLNILKRYERDLSSVLEEIEKGKVSVSKQET